jgi:protein-S-isoprenylcysteine O-methyltransferase Ste14
MKNKILDYLVANFTATLYLCSFLSWVVIFLKKISESTASYGTYRDIVLSLIIITTNLAFAGFFLFRRPVKSVEGTKISYVWAILGTYIPPFFNFNHFRQSTVMDILIVIGSLVTTVSILSLGKSIDVFASNRGIVTSGAYRYVRHPMYFSYLFLNTIYIILSPLYVWRTILFAIWAFCIYKRIIHEEKLLSKSRTYQDYTKQVKYRLIPYLW